MIRGTEDKIGGSKEYVEGRDINLECTEVYGGDSTLLSSGKQVIVH